MLSNFFVVSEFFGTELWGMIFFVLVLAPFFVVGSENSKNLTSMDLSGNQIGDKGAIAIANSPHLANLKSLDLYHNQITEKGMEALLNSKTLKSLESLILVRNEINPGQGADDLAKKQSLPSLRRLEMF